MKVHLRRQRIHPGVETTWVAIESSRLRVNKAYVLRAVWPEGLQFSEPRLSNM